MNFRPSSLFSPGLRWFNDDHEQRTNEMSSCAGAAERVCSVRHPASLSEQAAVFLISPYLADFAFWFFRTSLTPKSEGTF